MKQSLDSWELVFKANFKFKRLPVIKRPSVLKTVVLIQVQFKSHGVTLSCI